MIASDAEIALRMRNRGVLRTVEESSVSRMSRGAGCARPIGSRFEKRAEADPLGRMTEDASQPRVVVLGAGFGGLEFCRRFKKDAARVTVIDRQNHHVFQPLLYQVATAGLSAPEIAEPIRSILNRRRDIEVLLDEAEGVDLARRRIALRDNAAIDYDYLVLAVGARTNYFGNDAWEAYARGLKTLDDAMRIRHDVLLAFEEAECERDPRRREQLMRIVVVGGGPTGVEMAGALAELAKRVLDKDFRHIRPAEAEIVLLEVAPRILQSFDAGLSESARRQLEDLGVEVRLNQKIRDIREGVIELDDGAVEAGVIVWGAGVRASPVCDRLGLETDKAGRLPVEPDLSLPGYPEAFALGDIVSLVDARGKPVPGVSPAAMQMGAHAAKLIRRDIEKGTRPPGERASFVYFDKGNMATIGRSRAIAQIGRRIKCSGFPAWLAWLFVHLIFLVGFRNRMAVLLQWFYSYVTYRRGARIVTGLERLFTTSNPKARPASRAEKRARSRPPDGGGAG